MLFFLLSLPLLQAEDGEDPDEASPYLWTYQMGDQNVDFYWDGYWRFHFSSGLAVKIEDGGYDWNASFGDYTTGFLFLQTPDLLLSLWIDDRYFFETSVVEDYDKNTYLLGYQGTEEEYLQSVKLGNTSITTDSYAGLDVSSPLYNTPGITLKGASDRMQNELMIRFDGTWEESKTYIGTYEANEEYLELYDYLPNRRFLLPDTDIDSLRVYIRDDDGSYQGSSSYSYRLAEEGDYLIDSTEGILTLEEDFDGPVAVYYTSGGLPVGHSLLGSGAVISPTAAGSGIPDVEGTPLPFAWNEDDPYDTRGRSYAASRQETINGSPCLLIYEPERFSPFAQYSRYSYSLSLSANSLKNSLHLADRYDSETGDPSHFTWESDSDDKILTLYRTGAGTRDALSRYPLGDVFPEIYGNAPVNRTELVSHRLHLVSKTGSSGYRLGTGVVPGSLSVTVNGSPEYNYTLDSDRGTVTFNRYIFPDDRIVFTYRRETLNFEGQEMLIYQGNRFTLSERDTLETAESFNYVFPDGADSSTEDGGTVQLGVTWNHRGDDLSLKAELTGEADLGDADGIERILGMEDALSAYPVYEEALAEPKAGNNETDNDFPSADYVVMNSSSGPLVDESPAGAPFEDYALDASFTLASSEWTGADLHLTSDGTADYSTLQEIRFYVRVLSGTAGDLILKLGETGEKTDFDDDDFIEDYAESLVATEVIDSAEFDSGSWEQVTWSLDSLDRQALTKTRSLRFLFSNTDGSITDSDLTVDSWGTGSHRVLIGGLELVGQTFALSVENEMAVSTASVGMSEIVDSSLESAYSEEIEQFHKDGSDQRVTRIDWTGFDLTERWKAVSWIDAKDLTRFGKVRFFIKHDGSVGSYSLNLTDTDDKGVHLDWDTDGSETAWQMVTVDLTEKTARFDGGVADSTLTIDRGASALNRIVLTGEGDTDGSLWIDEIYFEEPVVALNGKTTVSLNYTSDAYLTGAAGFRWLGGSFLDLTTSGSLSGRTGGVAGREGSVSFQGQTGTEVMYLGLSLQGDGSWDGEDFTLWGGHGLTFPTVDSPLVLEENFARGDDSDTPLLSHTASADLTLPASVKIKGSHESVLDQEELTQDWSGSLTASSEQWQLSLKNTWDSLSEETSPDRQDYFSLWGNSWGYLIPDGTDVENRSASGDLSYSRKGERYSPKLTLSYGTTLFNSTTWKQTSDLSSSLSVPIKLGKERTLTLTPEYSRDISLTDIQSRTDTFADDYAAWTDNILPLLPLSHFVPLYELAVSENVMNQLPEKGTYAYNPAFSLALNRPYGSHISDLFLPSLAEAEISRLYKGETDSRYYKTSWNFTLQQRALNVFGSFGTTPVFPFYATEEIANTYIWTLSGKNSAVPAWETLSWNCYSRFEGEGGSTFTAENDLTYDFDEKTLEEQLSASYLWKTDRKPYRKIPFSRYIVSTESYVQNSETLSYEFESSGDDYSHETGAVHRSVLYIDDLGTLAGWMKLGVNWNETRTKAGSELGVELTLTF